MAIRFSIPGRTWLIEVDAAHELRVAMQVALEVEAQAAAMPPVRYADVRVRDSDRKGTYVKRTTEDKRALLLAALEWLAARPGQHKGTELAEALRIAPHGLGNVARELYAVCGKLLMRPEAVVVRTKRPNNVGRYWSAGPDIMQAMAALRGEPRHAPSEV
jgi:hypothetical protein